MAGSTHAPMRRICAALPYAVVIAVGAFLYRTADHIEFEQASGRIGPGAWPKIVLVLMLATALWGAISAARKGGEGTLPAESDADEALVRPPEIHPGLVWAAVGATIVYLLLLPELGFFLATILYSFALMNLGQYRRPLPAALLSLAIALAFMFMFMRVVYVALPAGVAPFDEVSYALMAAMGVH